MNLIGTVKSLPAMAAHDAIAIGLKSGEVWSVWFSEHARDYEQEAAMERLAKHGVAFARSVTGHDGKGKSIRVWAARKSA